jgi:hypothetical protein
MRRTHCVACRFAKEGKLIRSPNANKFRENIALEAAYGLGEPYINYGCLLR